jgi:hypothetical protein
LQEIINSKALENRINGFPEAYVYCGKIEDYEDDINQLDFKYKNLRIINGKIFHRANESDPHRGASMMFSNILLDAIIDKMLSRNFNTFTPSPVIFNNFSCSAVQEKVPDADLSWRYSDPRLNNPLLVVEVVFGHESFSQMVLELASYLTEFGTSVYSIGFQYSRNSIDFQALFFILRRREEMNSENREALIDFYKNKKKTFKYKDANCIKVEKTKIQLNQEFLDQLNCELVLLKEFNDTNYTEDFPFELDIPIEEESQETESVQFWIRASYLISLRESYREWFLRYRSRH